MTSQQDRPVQTAQDLLDQLFGIKTEVREGGLVSQVETTVTQILRANPSRIAFTITNLGTNFIFVLSDAGVSATRGNRLNGSGGQGVAKYDEDFARITHALFGIADTGASAILVEEVLIAS